MKQARILILLLLIGLMQACSPVTSTGQVSVRPSGKTIEIRGEQYYVHTVRQGETLYSIARAYGVSQEAIRESNNLTRDALRLKQNLLIPRSGGTTGTTSARPGTVSAGRPRQPGTIPSTGEPQTTDPGDDFYSTIPIDTTELRPGRQIAGQMREPDRYGALEIAVMLPLHPDAQAHAKENFSAFYKGVLLGLEALKAEGITANVQFLSTGQSVEKVEELIRSGQLDKANLIIGPVYPDAFEAAARFAAREGIPIVSPLGAVGAQENPFVFEAAPSEEMVYDRLFSLFSGTPSSGQNIIIVQHAQHPDPAILELFKKQYGAYASILDYTNNRNQANQIGSRLGNMLQRDKENVIFVPVSHENTVEQVLAGIASQNTQQRYRITVVGTSRWSRFNAIQLEPFFDLNVHIPTSYHADRTNPAVALFYNRYVESFGGLPTPYSFRGYDVVRYFAEALSRYGGQMRERLPQFNPQLLQVHYNFVPVVPGGKYRNTDWPVVNYRPDFTMQVK